MRRAQPDALTSFVAFVSAVRVQPDEAPPPEPPLPAEPPPVTAEDETLEAADAPPPPVEVAPPVSPPPQPASETSPAKSEVSASADARRRGEIDRPVRVLQDALARTDAKTTHERAEPPRPAPLARRPVDAECPLIARAERTMRAEPVDSARRNHA